MNTDKTNSDLTLAEAVTLYFHGQLAPVLKRRWWVWVERCPSISAGTFVAYAVTPLTTDKVEVKETVRVKKLIPAGTLSWELRLAAGLTRLRELAAESEARHGLN